ncbi:hypothetical protein OU994_21130 [Pseudoduganella sp. SL102]|nr:hypothetical protein [Pseudoduganella sp. SL102]WBS00797.1 hypothetical protein OU994_21130 [Pseudoduganella sp. SL102]
MKSPSRVCAAVVISADLIAAGDQPGCCWRSSAARPATCGLAIDVPVWKPNRAEPGAVPAWTMLLRYSWSPAGVMPARISRPGAARSGFMTPGTTMFGPRDENDVTEGDGCRLSWMPKADISSFASGCPARWRTSASPSTGSRSTVGTA